MRTRVGVDDNCEGLRSCSSSTRLQLIVMLSCRVDFLGTGTRPRGSCPQGHGFPLVVALLAHVDRRLRQVIRQHPLTSLSTLPPPFSPPLPSLLPLSPSLKGYNPAPSNNLGSFELLRVPTRVRFITHI